MTPEGSPSEALVGAVTVLGFAQRLGIGRTKANELLSRGDVRAIKIGRRTVVPLVSIQEYIERQLAAK